MLAYDDAGADNQHWGELNAYGPPGIVFHSGREEFRAGALHLNEQPFARFVDERNLASDPRPRVRAARARG